MTHLPLNTIRRLYLEKGLNRLATYLESTALSKIQEEQRIIIRKEAGPDWVGDCMHRDLEGTRYF